ncbi:hypothetical protein ACQEPT_016035 [Xanthomonas oryzae pv. oryzicola]|uniref:hypothetical protein n=1 Tax=Xanthomonas oryzae TaxID=347 RepID=UPI003DA186B3
MLIGLGLMAGYVAMRLQDTPTEEWTAKSIWGVADADVKWGSPQREQEELNKLLMGIRVEFEYGTEWVKSLGASAAAADTPSMVGEDARLWSKTVTTRLWMPQDLRAHLSYMLAVVLSDDVPPSLSSTLVWSPIPYPEEIGREEAFFRRTDHRLPARSRGRHADQGPVPAAWLQ